MSSKLNLTVQRETIYDIVKNSINHPTAADIMDALRERGHQFAYGTVYNSLKYLTDAGLIRELKLGDSASRYDGQLSDHNHIICRVCGRVDEVFATPPDPWIGTVERETGYKIHNHQTVFTGICPSCQAEGR